MGSHHVLVYQTFTPSLWELQMGQYIGLWEVHALAIKIKQNFPLWCSYLPAILGTLQWSMGAILLLLQKQIGSQLPGLFNKDQPMLVHVLKCPGPSPLDRVSSFSAVALMPHPGFNNSSLVCIYSCIGEAAMCVSMSTGLKAPFQGFSFKCHSTVG